jgi:hypothetical protein
MQVRLPHLTVSLALATALILGAGTANAAETWTQIKDDKYHFNIELPCAAKAKDALTGESKTPQRQYTCDIDAQDLIEVTVTDFSERTGGKDLDSKAVLDSMVSSHGMGVITDSVTPVTVDGATGRDLRTHSPTSVIHQRLYVKGAVMVQIVAGGVRGEGVPPEDTHVQNSFAFTN